MSTRNRLREMFPAPSTENNIQADIIAALGAQADLRLFRNHQMSGKTTGGAFTKAGLPPGSSDLVGILAPMGRWFCLEVKKPGEKPRPNQRAWAEMVRSLGGFATWCDSVESALAALERARRGENE